MRWILILFIFMGEILANGNGLPQVFYVLSPPASLEDSLAIEWLRQRGEVQIIPTEALDALSYSKIVWVHQDNFMANSPQDTAVASRLVRFYENGGRILLTGRACALVQPMGIEKIPPESRSLTIGKPEFWQKRGLQSYRGHPIFEGMFGGTYCWQPADSVTVWRTGYFAARPQEGKPIAIEKAYVKFLPDTILAWEYANGNGGQILCIGAYVEFAKSNWLTLRVHRLLKNALRYLAGEIKNAPLTYWPEPLKDSPQSITPPPSRVGVPEILSNPLSEIKFRKMRLTRVPATSDYWDVGGKHLLVTGKQHAGIDEIWVFPYRILHHFRIQLFENGVPLKWDTTRTHFTQWPEAIERRYVTDKGILREIIFAHRQAPGVVVHYQWEGKKPVQILIQFQSDLRWFWPYREDARANLLYAYDAKRSAFYYRTADGDIHVFAGADQKPRNTIVGPYKEVKLTNGLWKTQPTSMNSITAAALYELSAKNAFHLTVGIAGGLQSLSRVSSLYRALLVDPAEVIQQQQMYYDSLLTHSLQLETPDKHLNYAYRWAVVGLDRFKIQTPGVGDGLMAGFGTTARGWDGGHRISGRPGYAWYFGRDAAWAAMALIANGDTSSVKKQLQLFARFQSLEGKIFHELTPNGVVHYDAADATPLFIILAGKFFRATANKRFLQTLWPAIQKAMDFLKTTDWDGDGLINNYQVGHGWVEGGPLFGGKTTVYLAGLWQAALVEAAFMAKAVGNDSLQKKWYQQAQQVTKIIQQKFYLPDKNIYAQSIDLKGKPIHQLSILLAAIMNFKVLPEESVKQLLSIYASTAFTTDWGARIISRYSPQYQATGYHSGSVWPLFTGWLSLAEYLYGNTVQGFQHLMQNVYLFNITALGFLNEVYHGERFQPLGVCFHQAWSESAVLIPIYNGLLGIVPAALGDTLYLTPRIPGHWKQVNIRNIRIGKSRFDLKIKQMEKRFEYQFTHVEGSPITIMLTVRKPLGSKLKKVDGVPKEIIFQESFNGYLRPQIPIHLEPGESRKVKVHFRGGIDFFPSVTPPVSGAESQDLRILSIQRQRNRFMVTVEAKGGHDQYLGIRTFRQEIRPIKGAFLEPGLHLNEYWLRILSPKFTDQYIQKTVILELVNE